MPGIIGLISPKAENKIFHQMIDKINHFDYEVEKYENHGIHLARVHLNYINRSKQPIYSSDNRYVLIMIGEIFSYETIEGHDIDNDAKFFLELFIEKGIESLAKVNGHYAVCIHDLKKNETILISDRYGTRPLYYTYYNKYFIFAPEIKALIHENFAIEVNDEAISDLFHFAHLFGYKTMFKCIHQLPEASFLIFNNGKITTTRYWDYPYDETVYCNNNFTKGEINNYIDELEEKFTNSIRRQTRKNEKKLLFSLSGGLDSRFVVAMAHKLKINPIDAFTMGEKNSEDILYAKEVSEQLKVKHQSFKISPKKIWQDAHLFSFISDAMSMIYGPIQGFEPLRYYRKNNEVTLSAQMCDAIFGSTLLNKKPKKISQKKNNLDHEAKEILINMFNLFQIDDLEKIFCKQYFNRIKDLYKITPAQYLSKAYFPLHIYFILLLNEHGRRGTLCGNIMNNLFFETRMPSYDYDLMDLAYRIPIKLRENQFIYREAFSRMFPELAMIRRQGTNLPVNSSNLRLNLKNFERKIIGRLQYTKMNKLVKKFNRWNKPSYTNYKGWFQFELRNQMERIVLDRKTLSRGIFNKKGIQNLLYEHYHTEKNHARLIWQIINLELFHRNFID